MDQYDYKHVTQLTMKEAELERKIDFLLDKLNLQYVDRPPAPRFPEVEALLKEGKKLAAIKVYQLNTGAGLNDAKAAVEAIERSI